MPERVNSEGHRQRRPGARRHRVRGAFFYRPRTLIENIEQKPWLPCPSLSFVREIPVASSKGEEVIDQMKWMDQIE